MKTQLTRHYKKLGYSLLLLSFLSLTACVGDLNLSQYRVDGLEKNGKYVGLSGDTTQTAVANFPEQIQITFDNANQEIPVYLNGQTISQHFTRQAKAAVLDTSKVTDLLRQGVNTLSVAPLSFGPQISFSFDNAGPIIDVLNADSNNGFVDVSLRLKDTTSIVDVSIQAMDYQWDGTQRSAGITSEEQPLVSDSRADNFIAETKVAEQGAPSFFVQASDGTWNANIQEAKLYKITAKDAYGYETIDYYLAPEEKINNVFKLRLAKNLLDNVTPMLVPSMEGMHIYGPQIMSEYGLAYPTDPDAKPSATIDNMSAWWKQSAIFYGNTDMGAETSNENNCGFVNEERNLHSSEFTCSNIKSDVLTGEKYCLPKDMKPVGINAQNGKCSRIVLYRMQIDSVAKESDGTPKLTFTPKDNKVGRLQLDIELEKKNLDKALYTDMGIRNIQCEPAGFETNKYCKDRRGTSILGYWCALINGEDSGIPVDSSGRSNQSFSMAAHNKSGSDNAYCRDVGGVEAAAGIAKLGYLDVSANGANPSGDVDVLISNGNLKLDVSSNMKLNLSGTSIPGMGGFINTFLPLLEGILDGMFVDIVGGVLKDNMKDFKLGFDLKPDPNIYTDSSVFENPEEPILQMQSQAQNVWTNADNNTNTPLYWYMYYSGFFKATKDHPELDNKVLGSRYVMNTVEMPVKTDADGVDIAINMNIINQALMSLYRSGMTHVTVTSRKFHGMGNKDSNVHFGPKATDNFDFAKNDIRVELIPRTPGLLEMQNGSNGVQASLYYRNAKMLIETHNGSTWKPNFTVDVDMKVGVLMTAENQKFQMKVLGVPQLDINKIALGDSDNYIYNNENESVNVFVNNNAVRSVVQFAVDMVLNIAVPQIAEQVGELEYPGIVIPKSNDVGGYDVAKGMWMSTENIEANNNKHLSFGIGMDFSKPCVVAEGIELNEEGKPKLTFCDK